MMAVIVRPAPEQETLSDFDAALLAPVEISYYTSGVNGILPCGSSISLVPRNTDLEALAHMLELWSIGTNRDEFGT